MLPLYTYFLNSYTYIYRIDTGILSDVGEKLTKTKVVDALKFIREKLN